MNIEEGSLIQFIAGEDILEGVLSEYSYDATSGMITGFYLLDNPYMRYPIALLESERAIVLAEPIKTE